MYTDRNPERNYREAMMKAMVAGFTAGKDYIQGIRFMGSHTEVWGEGLYVCIEKLRSVDAWDVAFARVEQAAVTQDAIDAGASFVTDYDEDMMDTPEGEIMKVMGGVTDVQDAFECMADAFEMYRQQDMSVVEIGETLREEYHELGDEFEDELDTIKNVTVDYFEEYETYYE